jgi:hypothetical protein
LTSSRLGAYGIAFSGVDAAARWLAPVSSTAADLSIAVAISSDPCPDVRPEDDHVTIEFTEGGWATISRVPLAAKLVVPRRLETPDLVHPYLTAVCAQVAQWQDREVLHGAVVANGDRAVAVVGEREAGKTSLMAGCLADSRLAVMSDDLVVIAGERVFCGPRSLDMRPGAGSALEHLVTQPVRGSTRGRVTLPAAPADAHLAGVVVLQWGPLGLTRLEPSERLAQILPHVPVRLVSSAIERVLATAARPVWLLSRPKEWAALPASVELLMQALAA